MSVDWILPSGPQKVFMPLSLMAASNRPTIIPNGEYMPVPLSVKIVRGRWVKWPSMRRSTPGKRSMNWARPPPSSSQLRGRSSNQLAACRSTVATVKPKSPQSTSTAPPQTAKSILSHYMVIQMGGAPECNINHCTAAAMHCTPCFVVQDGTRYIANKRAPQRQEEILLSLIRLRSISLDSTMAAVGRLVFAEGHFEYKKRHTEIDSVTVR